MDTIPRSTVQIREEGYFLVSLLKECYKEYTITPHVGLAFRLFEREGDTKAGKSILLKWEAASNKWITKCSKENASSLSSEIQGIIDKALSIPPHERKFWEVWYRPHLSRSKASLRLDSFITKSEAHSFYRKIDPLLRHGMVFVLFAVDQLKENNKSTEA